MKKKLLSVLLVVCMVLTLMPIAAFADTIEVVAITIDVVELTTAVTPLPEAALDGTYTGVTIATKWYDSDDTEVTEFESAGNYTVKIMVTLEDAETIVGAYKLNGVAVTPEGNVISKTVTVSEPEDPTYDVSGTVSKGEGVTLDTLAGITVKLQKKGANNTYADVAGKTGTVDADGAYSITGVEAGEYKVVIGAVSGKYAESSATFTVVDADVEDANIELVAEEEPEPEEPDTYTVSGTVKKGNTVLTTSDLAGITVALYIEEEGEDGEPFLTSTDYVAGTDEGGVFTIADVPAGEYYAVVKPAADDDDALYADSQSSKITVTNKAVTGVTVNLKAATVTLTCSANPVKGGVVSAKIGTAAAGKEVVKGSKVTITAKANAGYVLTGIVLGDEAAELEDGATSCEFTITKDTDVVATFDPETYAITIAEIDGSLEGCSAEVVAINGDEPVGDVVSAAEGDKVAINVTAGEGYVVTAVKFVGTKAGSKVSGTADLSDGKYVFLMPGEAVTVTVEFAGVAIESGEMPEVSDADMAAMGNADDLDDTDVEALKTALNDADTKVELGTGVTVDKLVEEDTESELKADIAAAVANVEEGKEVKVEVYPQITPKSYVPYDGDAAEGEETGILKIEVDMMYAITVEDAPVGEPKPLKVNDEVNVSIKLPDGFVENDSDDVYVSHKGDVQKVNPSNGVIVVTLNGLSEVEITRDNPTVASIATDNYSSIEAAIKAALDSGSASVTINLLKSATVGEEIVVDQVITINITPNSDETLTDSNKIKAGDAYNLAKSDTYVYTFTAKEVKVITVNVKDNIGGSAYADLETAYAGQKVTITANPADGYSLDKIEITYTPDGESETVTDTVTNKQFTMPAAEVTVTVTFKVGSSTKPSSSGGSSVAPTVSVAKANGGSVGITNPTAKKGDTVTITAKPDEGNEVGTVTVTDKDGNKLDVTDIGNNKYTFVMPDGKVTVKVTFVDKETGETVKPNVDFTDVAEGTYYYDAVAWAVENGITNGIGENIFGPNSSCTRAQMVTFLWRLAGEPEASGTNPFADVAEDSYYYNAVLWAVSNGITNGTGENTFSPDATVTRGQSVTFLYRYAGQPTGAESSSFVDVAADAYYAAAVDWAAANGVTNGNGVDTFGPNDACTRAQIVTFMYRYAG